MDKKAKTEQAISHKASQIELKQKKKEENNLCSGYGKSSKSTQMR